MPMCKNPYMAGDMPCPCGKCMPCLVNRKRLWTHRILLESYSHDFSSFVTLTYNDDHLRYNDNSLYATLQPKDLQNFIKRIRKAYGETRLRFYAVGEYGDKSFRPHYHLALFGYPSCVRGETRKDRLADGRSCCQPCDLLHSKWGFGGIDNARIESGSASYIAGYVTKKLTKASDPRLEGRHPEFSRMSRRPGIGALDIDKIAETIFYYGESALTDSGDVPVSLIHGSKSLPLGRFLREKLREQIGVNDATKENSKAQYIAEMQALFKTYLDDPNTPKEKKLSYKHFLRDRDAQKILNLEVSHNLKKRSVSI